MKKALVVVVASLCVVATVALIRESAIGQANYKSFQLVYHSDTRGYFLPCG